MDLKYNARGTITDGTLARAMPETAQRINDQVGATGVQMVQERLDRVLRNPTGRYRASIHVTHEGDRSRIVDGTIYGGWLEGVSRRNRTTRFKGYRTFRLVAQELRREAARISVAEVQATIRRTG